MKSNLPAATAKSINEAHQCAMESAENAVEWAIKCGQLLVAKKEELKHGEFQAWIEKNCKFAYSTASRYMKAAQNSTAVEISSLSRLFPSGAKPKSDTPKGAVSVVKPKGTEETGADRPAAPATSPARASQPSGAEIRPEARPADHVEVAPAPDFDFDGYEPEDDDAYKQNIENVMMADDKLAAMREELKQVHRELAAVKSSRDHYQSEAGAAVRLIKARDREIEKLKRQLEKLQERAAA